MSPARRSSGGRGGSRKRRGGRGAGLAIAFLLVVGAGAAGMAMYLGFVPGPSSLLGRGLTDSIPSDTMLTAVPPLTDTAMTVTTLPPLDSLVRVDSTVAMASGLVSVADSTAGEAIYRGAGRCVGCHGANGEGAPGLGAPLRAGLPRSGDGSPTAIARVVSGGLPPSTEYRIAMPAYSTQLGVEDIARVAAYVYALAHPGATGIDSVRGDALNADVHPTVPAPPPARP